MKAPCISVVKDEPGSILIVVTHLLGIGHLSRAAAIGRALADEGHRVTLVSGGRPAPLVSTEGLDVVQLEPVHCEGSDFRTLLGSDGGPIGPEALERRRAALLAALEQSAPEVIITELYPFGRRQLKAEFTAMLEAARLRRPRPVVLASVRDILNPPSRSSRADEALEVLGRHYDRVLVHGDPEVSRLWDSWPVHPSLAERITDTGLVCDLAGTDRPLPPEEDPVAEGEIVVSGGGSAAALPLYEAAIAAARLLPEERYWRILVGPGVGDADFSRLQKMAGEGRGRAHHRIDVQRATRTFAALLSRAAVSVSQAGYNTMVDVALARVRSVVVPFEAGSEVEQRQRAEKLQEFGLVHSLRQARLTPAALADAVSRSLRSPRPDLAHPGRPALGRPQLNLSGLPTTATAVSESLRKCRAREAALSRFDSALKGLAAEGRFLDFWWRDDDAVAASPALDRLLAVSADRGVPVALAVIPARVENSLLDTLAFHPLVSVLQHGFSHENSALDGEKKIELGNAPAALLLAELQIGLRKLSRLFAGRYLPILVPPWNRIDPALIPLLPEIGFRGLSTFKPRSAPEAARGLVAVNTHCDPIAWRDGARVRDAAEIWADLASHIEAILEDRIDGLEPFGLLTHHLVHDEWTWRIVEDCIESLAAHPSVRLRTASAAFGIYGEKSPGQGRQSQASTPSPENGAV